MKITIDKRDVRPGITLKLDGKRIVVGAYGRQDKPEKFLIVKVVHKAGQDGKATSTACYDRLGRRLDFFHHFAERVTVTAGMTA